MATDPAPAIKIFGERNTSTTALRNLVTGNSRSALATSPRAYFGPSFKAQVKAISYLPNRRVLRERHLDWLYRRVPPRGTWKHAATRFSNVEDFAGHLVVFTVRHPASWLLALYRRPYHALWRRWPDFGAFLRAGWQTIGRDRLDRIRCTPAELYNLKLASYPPFMADLDRAGIPHMIVRFEDFARDQAAVFERLRPYLRDPVENPVLIEDSTKDASKDRAFYRDYYGNHRWLDDIAPADRDDIDAHVDWDVAGRFGYAPLASGSGELVTDVPGPAGTAADGDSGDTAKD